MVHSCLQDRLAVVDRASDFGAQWRPYVRPAVEAKGRLGTTYTTSALISQMNTKTLAACANAKAAGIKVYTVAFRMDFDPANRALLASCASSAGEVYAASDGTALIQAFESIGREIPKLRVAG